MAGHESSMVAPKAGYNNFLQIPAGSPLAIQGVFLEIIRERFATDAQLRWAWHPNPEQTGILIEATYASDDSVRNYSPAIYVMRTQTIPAKVVVGDRVGVRLRDHLEGFGTICTSGINIDCVSNNEGESAVIGDIVQYMLTASQDVIEREFGLNSISPPILEGTTPFERDQTKFNTPINFNVQYWVRWAQVPIAPLLQNIAQRIKSSGKDARTHFMELTIDSINKSGSGQ
jgi:hypothetical protein